MRSFDMRAAFASDPKRANKFSLHACGLLLDYSKNLITEETMRLLYLLAKESDAEERLKRQFYGEKVNVTEDLPALHTALRALSKRSPIADEVMEQAKTVRNRIYKLRSELIAGSLRGFSGKPIRSVVNIGIGGSYLGPFTVCTSLPAAADAPECDFLTSISPDALADILQKHKLETTIFIISSKSFSTQETLMNAKSLLSLYEKETTKKEAIKHFYAATAEVEKAKNYGLPPDNIFQMEKSIGGRFSLWSSIAFPIIMHIGEASFELLLKGAYDMDEHSLRNHGKDNLPLVMALLAYWYSGYWKTETQCVNVYEHRLRRLPEFLQQLFMESNGKQSNPHTPSEAILWGGEGTAVQHSYMQLCHQGKHLIPMDIIFAARPHYAKDESAKEAHRFLLANALAQSQALLYGRDEKDAQAHALKRGLSAGDGRHFAMPGNQPSSCLIYEELTSYSLGALLSLYEHRTALFGYLTDINSFDQWGVELGKQLSSRINQYLENTEEATNLDSSTALLIKHIHRLSKD